MDKTLTRDQYLVARRRMVAEQIAGRGIKDVRVLELMGELPRHLFVDSGMQDQAYSDHPLSIGEGQTISQPYIVALMTEALALKGHEKILEIGTGCGYQTAILARLTAQVHSIERIKSLTLGARRILVQLGLRNIILRVGDGTQGWPDAAPFDAILSAASSPEIPQPLVDQLAEGGRLILPQGPANAQELMRLTKVDGRIKRENLGACRFVKLVGKHGWQKTTTLLPSTRRSLV